MMKDKKERGETKLDEKRRRYIEVQRVTTQVNMVHRIKKGETEKQSTFNDGRCSGRKSEDHNWLADYHSVHNILIMSLPCYIIKQCCH